jgi:hypothetical protein
LVDTYCHDITKNYEIETCEAVNDLISKKHSNNSILLTWTKPESDLPVEGYRVFRNHHLLTKELLTDTFYLDEDLPIGNYEYYVITYYTAGCISGLSNAVLESIVCAAVNNLEAEKVNDNSILLTWTEPESNLQVEGYSVFRNDILLTEELITTTSYLDENLPYGNYEYYVITYYTTGCISDTSNRVIKTIDCKAVNDLSSEKISDNSILLTWTEPKDIWKIEGYNIFRNDILLTETIIDTSYLDENLSNGNYEYYVITHYTNGCISDTSNRVMETINVGIGEIGTMDEITIYPNPTTGELRIENGELKIENIEIFDVFGRTVGANLRVRPYTLDISYFPTGIYFIRIQTENNVITKKIIKN